MASKAGAPADCFFTPCGDSRGRVARKETPSPLSARRQLFSADLVAECASSCCDGKSAHRDRIFAAMHESLLGTFGTCRLTLTMYVHKGITEVANPSAKRRF